MGEAPKAGAMASAEAATVAPVPVRAMTDEELVKVGQEGGGPQGGRA